VKDKFGDSLAVVAPSHRAQAFPLDWVAKRLEGGGQFTDVTEWFERSER